MDDDISNDLFLVFSYSPELRPSFESPTFSVAAIVAKVARALYVKLGENSDVLMAAVRDTEKSIQISSPSPLYICIWGI